MPMWAEISAAAPYLFCFIGALLVAAILLLWNRGDIADLRDDISRVAVTVETLAQARGPVLANGEAVDVLEIARQLKQVEHSQGQQENWLRGIAGVLGKLHGLPVVPQGEEAVDADGKMYRLRPLERAWLKAIEEGRAEMALELMEQEMDFGGMKAKGKGTITIKPKTQVEEKPAVPKSADGSKPPDPFAEAGRSTGMRRRRR